MNNKKTIQALTKLKEAKNNFQDPSKFLIRNDEAYYTSLYKIILDIKDQISALKNGSNQRQALTPNEKLRLILIKSYKFIIMTDDKAYGFLDKNICDDVVDVCLFMGLCAFIQETKRIPASSLTQYIYTHSPRQFNKEGFIENGFNMRNPDYINLKYDKEGSEKRKPLIKTSANMRQYKSRLFANRPSPIPGKEWNFISKASEHEWLQYFDYIERNNEAEDVFADTFKRIGNLYNDLYKVLYTASKNKDLLFSDNYLKKLENASKKYQNKLKKIDFWNYFSLCENILEHIKNDTVYYGINLYRLEKEYKPYIIMQEMNRLIQCHDEKECFFLLNLSTCLKDIPYPKIYEKIANLKNHEMIPYCATNFSILIGEVIRTFMLVLDQFVEEDLFGKEFGQLFLKAINEMAENVLYEPIEYKYRLKKATHEMLQTAFSCLLTAPVRHNIEISIEEYVRWEQSRKSTSKE